VSETLKISTNKEIKLKHDDLMLDAMGQHDFIKDLIGDKSFVYVDMPVYGNIGDLLIMAGTLSYFKKNNLTPRIIAPIFAFDIDWIRPNEVVVFQGGGNFGDLYSGMQELREKVAKEKPDNRVIILPQTIHFSSPEAMAKSIAIFRSHSDIHLCVRDEQSYLLAQQFTNQSYLAPDMAHHLYPLNGNQVPSKKTLLLSRTDGEKAAKQIENMQFDTMTDWPELVGKREKNFRLFYLGMRVFFRVGLGVLGNKLFSKLWPKYANTLIKDAIKLFARHEYIVTDRLHGHILACLMSKPHTVLDNSYGKNSGYCKVWTARSDLVSLEEVRLKNVEL
jgi:pyruvyl transferase EpsO